jgi:hypothetical protein
MARYESIVEQEFGRIALDQGWMVNASIWDDVRQVWNSLPKAEKDKIVRDWEGMDPNKVLSMIANSPELQQKLAEVPRMHEKVPSTPSTPSTPKAMFRYRNHSLVKKVQELLNQVVGSGLTPDGTFGPDTAKAWNLFVKQYKWNYPTFDPESTRQGQGPDLDVLQEFVQTLMPETGNAQPARPAAPALSEEEQMSRLLGRQPAPGKTSSRKGAVKTAQDPEQDVDRMLAGVKPPTDTYADELVWKIQEAILSIMPAQRRRMATKENPTGVDGKWGPKTLDALGEIALVSDPQLVSIVGRLSSASVPGSQILNTVLDRLLALAGRQKAGPSPAGKETASPIKVPEWAQENKGMDNKANERKRIMDEYTRLEGLTPQQAEAKMSHEHPELQADDGLATASAVVVELVALANDLDDMGEAGMARAVDEQLGIYKAAVDRLYGITGETGEQLVGDAHPGGGPVQVPAKDDGGKVETVVEQQKKDMEAATGKPTGKQAAFVARQLAALANRLDSEGKTEAALLVDKTLAELREGPRRPFVVRAAQGVVAAAHELRKDLIEYIPYLHIETKTKPFVDRFLPLVDAIYKAQTDEDKPAFAANVVALEQLLKQQGKHLEEVVREASSSLGFGHRGRVISDDIANIMEAISAARLQDSSYFRSVEKAAPAPAPQAGKAEQKPGQKPGQKPAGVSVLSPEAQRLQSTLKTLLPAFEAAQMSTNRDKFFKALGGMERALAIKDGLKKMLANLPRYSEPQAGKANNFVWNRIYVPLRDAGLLSRASRKDALRRQAAPPTATKDETPSELAGAFPAKPGVVPGATPGARRKPGKTKRPDLETLQNIMLNLGIALPRHKADGRWGSETYQAWNTLRANIHQRGGGDIGPPTTAAGNGPDPRVVQKAINMARKLDRLYSSRATVHLTKSIAVPQRSLSDAQAFIRALAAQPNSGVAGSPREQAAAALKLAQSYRQKLEQDTSDESWALEREGGEEAVRARAAAMDALIGQLKAVETGVPSYKMPGGEASGQRGGRSGGYGEGRSVGEFGTLGGPGGGAGRGRVRGEPQMTLEARVYSPYLDVSGYVNDPKGFLRWAQAYKQYLGGIHEAEGAAVSGGTPVEIGFNVLERIGQEIARLEVELVRAPVGNREELKATLRERREAVEDVYRLLDVTYRRR